MKPQDTEPIGQQGGKRLEVLETPPDVITIETAQNDDDSASDSDEAPEMVTTATATSKVKNSPTKKLNGHSKPKSQQKKPNDKSEKPRIAEEAGSKTLAPGEEGKETRKAAC